MKVLHVISGGDTGGAKTSVINLLTALKEIATVKLVCFIEAEFSKEAIENGIDVLVLEQSNRRDFSVVETLVQMINDEEFNIVNCHGARANFIGDRLKDRIDAPLITTVHSDYLHDFDNIFYKKIIFTWLNKKSLKKMDAYITMANQFKLDMVARGIKEEKIYVAYNGITTDSCKDSKEDIDKIKFFADFDIPYEADHFYVGTASRLHPIKGVDVLLRAAKEIKQKTDKIKILVAGDGDTRYKERYIQYVAKEELLDTVFFLGHVKEIDDFYRVLNINTITSHSEAVCFALLEGGKYGRPSIASRVGGTPELIQHNQNGLLFEDNHHVELAACIMELFGDREKAMALGQGLKETVLKDFSNTAMAKRYYEIYTEIERTK